MSDVKVSRIDYAFFLRKRGKILTHIVLKLHSVAYASQALLRVGNVGGDEIELVKLKGDNSTLVHMLSVYAVKDVYRLSFGENGGAGVALFLGGEPI